MRLAVFTNKYPARVATFFERDMRALIEAGIDVHVFSIYPRDDDLWRFRLPLMDEVLPRDRVHHLSAPEAFAGASLPQRRWGTALRDAARVTAASARHGVVPIAKTSYVLPKAWTWARRHAAEFDHVLAYWGNYAGTCAYAFHRLAPRPLPFSIWLHAGTDLYRTPIYLREKMLYADAIITCCAFNRRFMCEQFADVADRIEPKIHVCYHGLDLAGFAFAPEGRPASRVIGVGRLARHKGYDYLLRATAVLARRGVPVELELVGDGEEREALALLAADLGIADRVLFRGWLPFEQVRDAMAAATILVHPSDGLGDGLPNVLREAMALGTPVIASDVAGIPEALDHGRCGLLVPATDVGALASALETLLGSPELRRRFAVHGRRHTERHFDLWANGSRLAEHLRTRVRGSATGQPLQVPGEFTGARAPRASAAGLASVADAPSRSVDLSRP